MNKFNVLAIEAPTDLIKRSLNQKVKLRCRENREIEGYLHAFDKHFNMMLSQVVETSVKQEFDDITKKFYEIQNSRKIPMMFLRGDQLISLVPLKEQEET